MLFRLFRRRSPYAETARALYFSLVAKARDPALYESLGVPDTLDGRYNMVVAHMALVLARMSAVDPQQAPNRRAPLARLAQDLFDLMIRDMDRNLREIGVSDMKVGKEVKKMTHAYYGRAFAYHNALRDGDLERVLNETVYRLSPVRPEPAQVEALAAYMRREAEALAGVPDSSFLEGILTFGPVPVPVGDTPDGSPREAPQ
ncbi:ubiquinol-cytochrome C chaperone family protein [Pararhodospirillum oryzae]|uniref:Ubiquinol-cytochrome c chaperone n=1 Tax=Pararhodospirillum oryzae TaxID=478448 RepID=A0A512H858_9PROT|nr:ubiquinol-cytochrome C chaperone family protein [Pararhodospirillum oryzae]GEO81622.1 ubiquinol-cytochrome c chaperone [Pararhodospirillum oryzae]